MNDGGLSLIVKTIALVLAIPITVFGLYVILHGHLTPGGGFPGGAIMATLIALFLVAFGSSASKGMGKRLLSLGESFGLMLFAALAFLGIGTTFFKNFLANSGGLFGEAVNFGANAGNLNTAGVIPLMNVAVGLEVFAALSLIMIAVFVGAEK